MRAAASNLEARYREPFRQQFEVIPGEILTVEYGTDRWISTLQIAPDGYTQNVATPDKTVNPKVVAEVIEFFFPGRSGRTTGASISCLTGANGGVCPTTSEDEDASITRRIFLKPGDPSQTLAVIVTPKIHLPQMPADLQARFGAPIAEEFEAESGIAVLAKYDAQRNANSLDIHMRDSLSNPSPLARDMPAPTVDRILEELVPSSERGVEAFHSVWAFGSYAQVIRVYANLTITRTIVPFNDQQVFSARVQSKAEPQP